ncbi:MAG: Asp-tRNA(Asn)/Glu-tRNA(Gln) amidotransferase subunit GatC [Tissierellia bacterium]|nr:Asp-tRNA(Asn)/Glu-tRNA(Gln) amidotransferase subunit GatC [Tissierellia bacterium]
MAVEAQPVAVAPAEVSKKSSHYGSFVREEERNNMNKDEVIRIYDLANLELDLNQIDKIQEKYNTVLSFAQNILEVDTEDVTPMEMVDNHDAHLRADEVRKGLEREDGLKNAKDREYGYFRLKKVL